MKKNYTSMYCKLLLAIVIALANFSIVHAQPISTFNENMDHGLITPDWSASNRSQNRNTSLTGGWLLGQAGSVSLFGVSSYNGPDTSYMFSYYGVIASGKSGTISAWLLTPELNLANGAVLKFWTRSALDGGVDEYPDRMEVRMSTNGASTNLGSNVGPIWNTVGDFTNLLLSINPDINFGVYPQEWTEYTVPISGLAAPVTGRLAFRYFVTDGGPAGSNSEFVGLDQVSYDANAALCIPPFDLRTKANDTAVKLKWAIPGTQVTNYKIRYRPSGATTWIKAQKKGDKDILIITGLTPATTYEWQIRSQCGTDESDWVNGPAFTTTSSFSAAKTTKTSSVSNTKIITQITPNPNKGNFTIQLNLPDKIAATTLTLYNYLGQKVWQQNAGQVSGTIYKPVYLQNKIPAGMYSLVIQHGEIKSIQKMIINP